jgi:pimeloyl-ACP methyl ester carboxylesterase
VDPSLDAVQGAGASAPPQPALYLHGRNDGCIGVDVADGADAFLTTPGSRAEIVDGAGHFLHLERPAEVNALITEFLAT